MFFKKLFYSWAAFALLFLNCSTYYYFQDYHATILNPNSTPIPAIGRKQGDFRFSAGIAGKPHSYEYSFKKVSFKSGPFTIIGSEYAPLHSPNNIYIKQTKIQGSLILDKTFTDHFFSYLNSNTDGNCLSLAFGCGYYNTCYTSSNILSNVSLQAFGFQSINRLNSHADIINHHRYYVDGDVHYMDQFLVETDKSTSDIGCGIQFLRQSRYPFLPSLGFGIVAQTLNLRFPGASLHIMVPSLIFIQRINNKNQLSLNVNYFYSSKMKWPYIQFGWSIFDNNRK
jgi:hypothetical protein